MTAGGKLRRLDRAVRILQGRARASAVVEQSPARDDGQAGDWAVPVAVKSKPQAVHLHVHKGQRK